MTISWWNKTTSTSEVAVDNSSLLLHTRRFSMTKKFTFLLILILGLGLIAGCGGEKTDKAKDEVIPVRVMKAELKNIKRALEYVGTIKGQDEVVVYPKISCKIIEKVKEDGTQID